ncbi:23S rRNA (adenine(2503)-C(2))-methyltransferase RlmN [Bradymonadaceae bacterium TMQ3]|uniref:Probable dual-specificity RNA methyltransferase RlmN n=1 Tax=Lujinxingia sediminis TaxID=2480984 RepID=A0ABY0CX38_9DELT|nr:23S rRNA (adenine(2503)-C(2))-methyltransferase RlmN [Lujinxingia sediminis]RDV39535.1 23S rRNA (adenine(2503)-C(2))-methyltransferase RlmN [Bradymonadaceae bacterium TMQ3]RVU48421.1 23S rRNA (adenine(2503)-C(2))-methyltransferase RlmN [Lujinxingia sediminis]TXC77722.1 23S rRNA (adenine(2503)-C(2))-methyltransferase RlmN [Bradymonadales bacterium TMQ1]
MRRERSPSIDQALEALSQGTDELGPIDLKNFTQAELKKLLAEGFGEKAFRAKQVYQWLYLHLADDFEAMTNLSKGLREQLSAKVRVSSLEFNGSHTASDGTTKLTFKCDDGAVIETVYIPSEGRNTLCISSQVGCAMGCTFCYTAKMGLKRNLSTAEIVEQVVQARRRMGEVNGHIGNIVFMGMGEPLHNVDNVIRAIHILTDEQGLNFSRRKVTVSTSGLVPAIKRLGEETDVQLAISLNATTDETRGQIMPVNDRWDLETLMAALKEFPLTNRERITFEYVMIRDLNDTLEDAQRIIELTRDIPSKINLIPFNPHPRTPFQTPPEERIDAFQKYLVDRNVGVYRRRTRGRDEMAACGQLGKPGEKEPPHVRKRLEKFRNESPANA